MATNSPRPCTYAPNQRVEVLANDFQVPGFPERWTAGLVTEVRLLDTDRGIWDVLITLDRGGFGHQLVGPRGGNKCLRPEPADKR